MPQKIPNYLVLPVHYTIENSRFLLYFDISPPTHLFPFIPLVLTYLFVRSMNWRLQRRQKEAEAEADKSLRCFNLGAF